MHLSKLLALVLRHRPADFGVVLDSGGWAEVGELLAALAAHGHPVSRAELLRVVATNDKRRFALSADGDRIRANQGHSIAVDLGLAPGVPPDVLYHGTTARFLPSIRARGLVKGERTHVHLSSDRETAERVGRRRGRPVVLEVKARTLHGSGVPFFLSENGVWLVGHVPPAYLVIP